MNDLPACAHHDSVSAGHRPPWVMWGLAAILGLGVLLRVWQVGESLWLDELHTSWVVADGLGEVVPRAQLGNQSPVYFGFVWCLVQLLGHHAWTLRLLSLLAGCGLIVAVFMVVRRWTSSDSSALLAALLVAVERNCIFYAQEARPYALLQFSAVLHANLLLDVWRHPTRTRRAAWVAGAAWLFYLHYTSVLFLVAEVGSLAWNYVTATPRPAYRWTSGVLDMSVAGVLMLPAAGHLMQIAQYRENWTRFVSLWPLAGWPELIGVFVLLPLAGLGVAAWRRLPAGEFRWRGAAGRWTMLWWSVPPAVAILATWSGLAALAMLRYTVASLAGVIVFAACCHARYAARSYRIALALTLVVATVASSGMIEQYLHDGRWVADREERWDALVAWLNTRWEHDRRPVLLWAGLLEDGALQHDADQALRDYCRFPLRGIYRLHATPLEPLPSRRGAVPCARLVRLVAQQGGAWLIVRARPQSAQQIADSLSQQLEMQRLHAQVFGNVTVFRLSIPADESEPVSVASPL